MAALVVRATTDSAMTKAYIIKGDFTMRARMSRSLRRLTIFILLVLVVTNVIGVAQAAVWTDKADYQPGSVVTISGDNSDNAGYAPNETVHVAISGPNNYAAACDTTADGTGVWACQVTLVSGSAAVGAYAYTALGQASGMMYPFVKTEKVGMLQCMYRLSPKCC